MFHSSKIKSTVCRMCKADTCVAVPGRKCSAAMHILITLLYLKCCNFELSIKMGLIHEWILQQLHAVYEPLPEVQRYSALSALT